MEHHLVLRVVAKLLIPMILIFALYVQFHGDYGPGGGFQAGVIFASAFILYSLIFGIENVRNVISFNLLRIVSALGLLLYIGVGISALIFGGNFLDYNVLATNPLSGQHIGIMLIEFGVGMTVAAVMMMMFFVFSRP
ncbi:MAG: Na(+)/H(+) antiporter subunit B [Proteobacteria bacterium]|nr:Na(+)/H(+) antiporter subunit B [Pseudomonadota bacterium]